MLMFISFVYLYILQVVCFQQSFIRPDEGEVSDDLCKALGVQRDVIMESASLDVVLQQVSHIITIKNMSIWTSGIQSFIHTAKIIIILHVNMSCETRTPCVFTILY